jgi:hypothetical protein
MRFAEEDTRIIVSLSLMLFLGFWAASLHRPAGRPVWSQYMCGDLYGGMTIEGHCRG